MLECDAPYLFDVCGRRRRREGGGVYVSECVCVCLCCKIIYRK